MHHSSGAKQGQTCRDLPATLYVLPVLKMPQQAPHVPAALGLSKEKASVTPLRWCRGISLLRGKAGHQGSAGPDNGW